MKKTERIEIIKKIIMQQGLCPINDFMNEIGVSDSTIRRDLAFLEKQGFIERYHGGAADYAMLSHIRKLNINRDEKEEIAKKASNLVKDNQIIILGAGSTTSILADHLLEKKNLTIITPSISIAKQLASKSNFKIILTGGELDLEGHSLTGHLAELTIQQISADIAFLGCDSISPNLEIMNASFEIATLKKYILKASLQKILVADYTKFDAVNLASIGSIAQFDKIIVDSKLSSIYINKIRELGVEVI